MGVYAKKGEKREEIKARLKEGGIQYIWAQFVDINGAAKVKQVPFDALDDIVDEGAGFAGGAVWGLNQGPHSHDLMARADVETFRQLPWKPNTAVVNCNLFVDDEPWPACSRTNLIRMMDLFAKEGYVLNGGFEPEHFLVARNQDGTVTGWDPQGIDTLAKPCYDVRGIAQAVDYLQDVMKYCAEVGMYIYQCDHEDGNWQYEVNWQWADMLTSSDMCSFFHTMAPQVAAKYGFNVTFMAKPFEGKTGTGNHLHFHVADAKTGENLFPLKKGEKDWKDDRLGYSKLAYHFIGGLQNHKDAICAVSSPTVNCYRRIQSGEAVYSSGSQYTWTPAWNSFGDNNRTQMFRSPANNRFEDRSISGMANPYLVAAVFMAAGLDGIKNEIDPGEPVIGENVWDMPYEERRERGMTPLPQDLGRAVDALEQDEVVKSGLGAIANDYIRLKRAEWGKFMMHVTDWEVKRYLSFV
jgi:glutamine synthetase